MVEPTCEFCDDEHSVWDDAAGCWFDCVCIEPDQNHKSSRFGVPRDARDALTSGKA